MTVMTPAATRYAAPPQSAPSRTSAGRTRPSRRYGASRRFEPAVPTSEGRRNAKSWVAASPATGLAHCARSAGGKSASSTAKKASALFLPAGGAPGGLSSETGSTAAEHAPDGARREAGLAG